MSKFTLGTGRVAVRPHLQRCARPKVQEKARWTLTHAQHPTQRHNILPVNGYATTGETGTACSLEVPATPQCTGPIVARGSSNLYTPSSSSAAPRRDFIPMERANYHDA
ncbi:hypothetical protein SCP_0800070 [Sparassis crispa]|uniref:Uncharacterized protein n=1 Tax=Sparassis crispa TaxID=139825 RepID=A0A401GTH7_9APHY|nr:hypothetical protein SCP_0800070 [Sparassis crispa]GBE85490.1 hypothetical protein SCP_0800070 [Sparassis crispa]